MQIATLAARPVLVLFCSLTLVSWAQQPGSMGAESAARFGATKPAIQTLSYPSANGIKSFTDIFSGNPLNPHTLKSRLYLPGSCADGGRVPAVIIQHGSGAPRHRWYPELARALNQKGIAALVANSYSTRGILSTSGDQRRLSAANRTYDAFAAFRALHGIPCIDPDRIGITGYSFGGLVSLLAVETAFAERLGAGRVFKAGLPVYPYCLMRMEKTRPTNTKVHYLLAALDDYTPARDCLDSIPQLKAAGWDIDFTVYPGAHHGFIADTFYGRSPDNETYNKCGAFLIKENGHSFLPSLGASSEGGWDAFVRAVRTHCMERGTTSGRHEKSRALAMDFTVKFFSENL